jgi:dihydropteroate synthase
VAPMTFPNQRANLPEDISERARIYLRPVELNAREATMFSLGTDDLLTLAGGRFAFKTCEVILRDKGRVIRIQAPVTEIMEWSKKICRQARRQVIGLFERLTAPRLDLAGRSLKRPLIMGIVNITPDSFSDGGEFADRLSAVAHARALAASGSDILDIGGESSRPGARPVSVADELQRVLPVIEALVAELADADKPALSIDTRHADVMTAALRAGATIINDITALTGDRRSLAAAGAAQAVVLMHMQGEPQTMNENPVYDNVALDVFDFLEERVEACIAAGIERRRLIVDPGIGFGKKGEHNLEILRSLTLFHGIGCPILLGVSRKGLTTAHDREYAAKDRLPGSLAATLAALDGGVQLLRVHDVRETRQAISVWDALTGTGN